MKREDWVTVGLRLYGAYLVINALLTAVALLLGASASADYDFGDVAADVVRTSGLTAAFQLLCGAVLFFGGASLAHWTGAKDARVLDAKASRP